MNKKGFTLVEILIVLAITAVLSGIAIVYSHVGESQISLSIEESKIGQLILEARELSIATYSQSGSTCAYGVSFDYTDSPQRYSLFEYNAKAPGGFCPSLASTTAPNAIDTDAVQIYAAGTWQVPVAQGVELINATSTPASETIQYVMFYPPDPFTLISTDGQTFLSNYTDPPAPAEASIYLQTFDGSLSRTITMSPSGQVNL